MTCVSDRLPGDDDATSSPNSTSVRFPGPAPRAASSVVPRSPRPLPSRQPRPLMGDEGPRLTQYEQASLSARGGWAPRPLAPTASVPVLDERPSNGSRSDRARDRGRRQTGGRRRRVCIAQQLRSAIILDDHLTQSDPTRVAWVNAMLREAAESDQII